MQDKAAGKDVIIMSVGDPDFATPTHRGSGGILAARRQHPLYPILGKLPLREAIAAELMRVSGSDAYRVDPDEIMVTAGTQNAFSRLR